MKYFICATAILACVVIASSASVGLGTKIECFRNGQTRLFESQIKQAIEKIRDQLKNGIPALNIPPLDPLVLENERLYTDNEFFTVDLNMTTRAEGLLGFEITNLKLSLIGLKFDFTVTFPSITAKGNYGFKSAIPSVSQLNLFGNGDFDVTATDFIVTGSGKIKTKFINGKLIPLLERLEIDLNVADFDFTITGLMDNEELSKEISGWLSEKLPELLQEYNHVINAIVEQVIKFINDLISKGTFLEQIEFSPYVINCGGY